MAKIINELERVVIVLKNSSSKSYGYNWFNSNHVLVRVKRILF